MLLLVLTAADVTNSIACALDGEDWLLLAATTLDQPSSSTPDQSSAHVDDCFCCSHCVDVQSAVPPLTRQAVIAIVSRFVTAAPHNFGSPLYHPPLV